MSHHSNCRKCCRCSSTSSLVDGCKKPGKCQQEVYPRYKSINKQLKYGPSHTICHGRGRYYQNSCDCNCKAPPFHCRYVLGSRKTKQQLKIELESQLKNQNKSFKEMTIRNDLWRNNRCMLRVMTDANFAYHGRQLQWPNQREQRFKDLASRHNNVQKTTIRCFQRKYN